MEITFGDGPHAGWSLAWMMMIHDDVLDEMVEPIGFVDTYSMMVACLMVEPHDGDIDVIWCLGDG